MIKLCLLVENPWSKDRFKNLGSVWGKISKNKSWELEHSFYDSVLLDLDFRFSIKGDHAGLYIALGFIGYSVRFDLYDNRHWDYKHNRWENHD